MTIGVGRMHTLKSLTKTGEQVKIPYMEGIVRKQTCTCGAIKGKKTILNSHAIVGVTTEFQDNEVFKNNKGLYLENNYCPQCGTPYEIVEDGQKKLFLGEESA